MQVGHTFSNLCSLDHKGSQLGLVAQSKRQKAQSEPCEFSLVAEGLQGWGGSIKCQAHMLVCHLP